MSDRPVRQWAKVTLVDGRVFNVGVDNRDFRAYDLTYKRHGWPPGTEAPFLVQNFIFANALVRAGEITDMTPGGPVGADRPHRRRDGGGHPPYGRGTWPRLVVELAVATNTAPRGLVGRAPGDVGDRGAGARGDGGEEQAAWLTTAILAIKILADAKGAQKGMAQAETATTKFASGMATAGKVDRGRRGSARPVWGQGHPGRRPTWPRPCRRPRRCSARRPAAMQKWSEDAAQSFGLSQREAARRGLRRSR